MPRFYIDAALRPGTSVLLPEDSAHHAVHVLRVQGGDEITLFNGRGGEYAARIASIQRLKLLVDVLAHRAIERESPLHMVLVQGVSAGERMDFTVRKSVELGVAEIHPLLAATSVARPKGERAPRVLLVLDRRERAIWLSFRNLGDRVQIPEVQSFVLAIRQADEFGISVSTVLRDQAEEMRIHRRQVAQEKAQKAPVKMLIPMVFCIFPALFIIVLGPAVINIYKKF